MEPKELVSEFIRRCDAAVSGASGEDPYALLTEDVEVKVQGRTVLSGDYPTLEIVRMVLVGSLAARVAKAHVELDSMIGQGSRVATLLRITGETTDGQVYNSKRDLGGCIFGMAGDKISQIVLFLDNTVVETVLLGRQYLPTRQEAEA